MSGDDYQITMDDAQAIVLRVVDDDGFAPLAGKEEALYRLLLDAQRRHDEAIGIDAFRREHPRSVVRLRNALENACKALEETDVNLDVLSSLDRRLRHGLREMVDMLDFLTDRRDQGGRLPRAMRKHPDKISSVGIRAVVEVLFDFWDRETDLPFSDDFGKPLDDNGNEAALKPKGLAAMLVFETARLIDPGYTAEACSDAMRPR